MQAITAPPDFSTCPSHSTSRGVPCCATPLHTHTHAANAFEALQSLLQRLNRRIHESRTATAALASHLDCPSPPHQASDSITASLVAAVSLLRLCHRLTPPPLPRLPHRRPRPLAYSCQRPAAARQRHRHQLPAQQLHARRRGAARRPRINSNAQRQASYCCCCSKRPRRAHQRPRRQA